MTEAERPKWQIDLLEISAEVERLHEERIRLLRENAVMKEALLMMLRMINEALKDSRVLKWIVLAGCAMVLARAETADEWLSIVSEIQRTPCAYKDNHADELFIAKMVNLLTLDAAPAPTLAEQKWILTLKRECLRKANQ